MTRDVGTAGLSDQRQSEPGLGGRVSAARAGSRSPSRVRLLVCPCLAPPPRLCLSSIYAPPSPTTGGTRPPHPSYRPTCEYLRPPPEGARGPDTQENQCSRSCSSEWQSVNKPPSFLVLGVGQLRGPRAEFRGPGLLLFPKETLCFCLQGQHSQREAPSHS